jgi:hypothetical protein
VLLRPVAAIASLDEYGLNVAAEINCALRISSACEHTQRQNTLHCFIVCPPFLGLDRFKDLGAQLSAFSTPDAARRDSLKLIAEG